MSGGRVDRLTFEYVGKTIDCWVSPRGVSVSSSEPHENARWYFCVDGGSERPGPLAFEADGPHEVQAIIQEILEWHVEGEPDSND